MKWFAALAAVALSSPAWARGLKMPRDVDAGAVRSKELEAENEALRKQNAKLETMMQMARVEVQRMDAAAHAHTHRRENGGDGDVDVLKQEIEDMKKKLLQAAADKNDLVQSLRHMLTKNSTQTFEKQAQRETERANRAEDMKMTLELKLGQEREALKSQEAAARGKCDDTKELASNLQEENADLKLKLGYSYKELAKSAQANKELASDKKQLVKTMQGLMRDSTKLKHGFQQVSDQEKKEASELSASKALLAKLAKKNPAAAAAKKQAKTMLKSVPRRHEHMTDAQRAHVKEMDRYIDSAEPGTVLTSDEIVDFVSDQQLRAVRRQEDLIAKGKVGAHLSDWLGLKPANKAAAKVTAPTKAPASPKVQVAQVDDDGEGEAEALVTQAKAQLTEMEHDDSGK